MKVVFVLSLFQLNLFLYYFSVYTDTRQVAANAVDAGKAYENIVKAIDAAHEAAKTAVEAAESAKMKVNICRYSPKVKLFLLFDLIFYVPVNSISVMTRQVFPG